MSSTYILTNLLQRIDSLESKIYNIENRQCCSYGSTKDRNIFEYANCLLNFSKDLKKDLLYQQEYFKSRHNQMISQMCDKVSILEDKILNLLQPQVTFNSNSTIRYPCKMCNTARMGCNKPEKCCNSTVLGRYSHSPLHGSMIPMNDSSVREFVPNRYFEELPFESKKALVEESSSDLSEYLLLTDSSSTSEIGTDEEIYYIESSPVSTTKSRKKPKYKRSVQPIVPVSIYRSKTKPSTKRMASAKPKSKPNFSLESSNVQRNKKKSNKHKPRRKKDHKKLRMEKSDSQRVAINASQPRIQNNKTEVFFVKDNYTSPLHNRNNSVNLSNEIIYVPYSKEFKSIGEKLSSNSRKVEGGDNLGFNIPTDQALYYVDVNPVSSSSKRNKSEKHERILFDANEKRNSKTSIESQFIKSKWKHSIRNGSPHDNKKGGSHWFENYANDYQTLGIEPKLNDSVRVVSPKYKLNSNDPNVHSNKQTQLQENILSKSLDDKIKMTNEVYSVINTHSNGDILLKKLSPHDVVVLQNENSINTSNGFEVLKSSIIPGKNNERSSFSKPFGVNTNPQSVFVMSAPLYNNMPANSNDEKSFNDISEPNITPDVDRKSTFGPKPSILSIDPDEPNNEVQTDNRTTPNQLKSAILRHKNKLTSHITEEKENLKDDGSKTSMTSFIESNKKSVPNIKNKFEPGSISNTSVPVEGSFSKQKKSNQNIQDKNIKSSRISVNTLFNRNKKTKSGTLNNLKTGSGRIQDDSGNKTRSEPKEIEIINTRQTIITPLKETGRIKENYNEKHIETAPTPKSKEKNHDGTTNQNCSKLNYSLHFEKERHAYLEINSIPNSLSLLNIIPSNCNKVKSQREIIFSEHKLNGKEYHGKVHEFFANPTCCRNKKILIPRRKCLHRLVSQDNCRCTSYRSLSFNNCHRQSTNCDPTTDNSYSLDWKSIAHKVKERK